MLHFPARFDLIVEELSFQLLSFGTEFDSKDMLIWSWLWLIEKIKGIMVLIFHCCICLNSKKVLVFFFLGLGNAWGYYEIASFQIKAIYYIVLHIWGLFHVSHMPFYEFFS
jgi:hypothetical protein